MPEEISEPKIDTRSRKVARRILATASIIGLFMTASFWLRLSFWFELPSTYIPQLSILIVSLLMLFAAAMIHEGTSRGWRKVLAASVKSWLMLVVAVVTLAHGLIMTWLVPERAVMSSSASSSPSLRVMTFNKLYDNRDYTQIANYIESRRPDILAIEEIFFDEAKILATKLHYEQWHMASCDCSAYGSDLAIFSRFPLINVDMAFEDRLGGVLRAEIELGVDDILTVYVAHIVPPYSSRAYDIRETMLEELADSINNETGQVILMGDFNSSPYSVDIRNLNSDVSELNIVGKKPWAQCTWFGYSELACASIDHIFVPVTSEVINYVVGPNIGSDHRPVDVDLVLN